jgi:uncharacterized protein (DUF4415 family)
VLAVLHGEPRRIGHKRKRPSFETPRKCAAPLDDGRVCRGAANKKETDAMATKPKFDPALHDENPGWTKRDFARAKPASEVLPADVLAQFKNKGGRPRIENPKQAVKLRIDADVLAKFRESGPGWQTRINGILRAVSAHASRAEAVAAAKRMGPKPATRPKPVSKSVQSGKRRHA